MNEWSATNLWMILRIINLLLCFACGLFYSYGTLIRSRSLDILRITPNKLCRLIYELTVLLLHFVVVNVQTPISQQQKLHFQRIQLGSRDATHTSIMSVCAVRIA